MILCNCPYKIETVRDDIGLFYRPSFMERDFIVGYAHTPECNERRYRELMEAERARSQG